MGTEAFEEKAPGLAAWIEQHDDTGLARMADEFAGIKRDPAP